MLTNRIDFIKSEKIKKIDYILILKSFINKAKH